MKKYWNKINLGWKRIHYFLSLVFSSVSTFIVVEIGRGTSTYDEVELTSIWFCFIPFYFLIIITIEWIKDGFKERD
tara:strand:- start:152 stop:379 length:228 start_codon:yes stop_codon:yes gene_type:complete